MAVHLVTGHAGAGHVTSADAGLFNAGICGAGKYVLETGTKFAYTLESNNLIRIGSGDLVNQGRHISIPTNSSVALTINNGAQGVKRYDLIVMRYTKDAGTGVESADLVLIKGTETSGTPVLPPYTNGNIFAGALQDDMPLYQISINGLQVTEVTKLFAEMDPISRLKEALLDSAWPVGSIYTSVNSTSPATLFGGTWTRITGRFLLAASTVYAAGATGGEATHTLTASEMPSHAHTGPSHTHTMNHSHTIPSHTHTGTTGSAGGHVHRIIRWLGAAAGTARWAVQGTDTTTTVNTQTGGAHTHTFTTNAGGAGNTGTHSGNTGASGNGNTGNTGGGNPHNNMPPYLSVYVWKRTA